MRRIPFCGEWHIVTVRAAMVVSNSPNVEFVRSTFGLVDTGSSGAFARGRQSYEEAIADLDLERVREERLTLDVSGHYARPDALTRVVRRTGRGVALPA